MPPSATISVPSRNEESELARKSAVLAISSGRPKRFIGTWDTIACRVCSRTSGGSPRRPKIGVVTGPGLMALTRMLRPTSSAESVGANGKHIAPELLGRVVERLLVTSGNDDFRALVEELLCRGEPDAAVAAGDDGHFAFQLVHTGILLL